MKFHYNPPGIIKKIFPDFLWHTRNNEILLTFDDGPNPGTTEVILEALDKANLKAVFFCVGNNVRKYPQLAADIIQKGHLLANHTFNHQNVTFLDKKKLQKEVVSFNDLLLKEHNYSVRYFRPPHGRFGFNLGNKLKEQNLLNVMWSLLTFDYKNDLNIVKFSVKNYILSDSIIVLHDSRKSKDIIKHSIEYILETSGNLGYKIGAPSECLS